MEFYYYYFWWICVEVLVYEIINEKEKKCVIIGKVFIKKFFFSFYDCLLRKFKRINR